MRSAFLGSFNGLNGSGSWTLFAADLQLGETSRLNDWSIELEGVSAVPEPTTNALILFAALLGARAVWLRRRRKAARRA